MNSPAPKLNRIALEKLVERWHESPVTISALPSYRDLNALVEPNDGSPKFVLKIANSDQSREVLEAENALLRHVRKRADQNAMELAVPQVLETQDAETLGEVEDERGRSCWVRAISCLPGKVLAKTIKNEPLMISVGENLGRLSRALADFDHAGLHRELIWDLDRAPEVIHEQRPEKADPGRWRMVQATVSEYQRAADAAGSLPQAVIHGDANDYNLLVQAVERDTKPRGRPTDAPNPELRDQRRAARFEAAKLSGIVDFGDVVYSSSINDLAIAVAYCLFGPSRRWEADPVAGILPMVAAYHAVRPVSEQELTVLFPKALLRLGLSVTMSATNREQRRRTQEQSALDSSDQSPSYQDISAFNAWNVIERYTDLDPMERHAVLQRTEWRLRAACGYETVPGATQTANRIRQMPVEQVLASTNYRLIDLSFETGTLVGNDPADEAQLTRAVSQELGVDVSAPHSLHEKQPVGWGRYSEPRALYVGEQFRSDQTNDPATRVNPIHREPRTVHLGVDLFAPPGTEVHAPIAGRVHSFADNAIANDYGPTILLEHQLEGHRFLTLYGHLSRQSLKDLSVGQTVEAGEAFATLGSAEVNGGWTPHLHFQIMLDDLGLEGNYPGVAEATQLSVWQETCPDPNLLLRWSAPEGRPVTLDRKDLWARRRASLSPSLSLSYQRPLHVTYGRGQFLYENNGHRYLDLVNNVSHVGHCHPKVVRALAKQAATLNTNSRYLHRNVVDYAERLLSTVPRPDRSDPLEVCFLVNSGSEANDLALRMARNFTGRDDVICLDGAYHGHLTSTVEVSPYKHDGPGGSGTPTHVHKVSMPDTYRGTHRDLDAADRYGEEIDRVIEGHAIAAFIAEPILSCGGQIELPKGYLAHAYRATRAQGGVCVADEVQVGFGRVGSHFWAFETQGVVPDILTIGKPIGNGHPLAAVLTTKAIAESFANGMEYFNTYGGNPVSCAVGLAVLDVLEEEDLQRRAEDLGNYFVVGLEELQEQYDCIGDVRGRGLFLGFELVKDRSTRMPDPELAWYLVQWMRERGFLLSTDGPDHNVIKIKPPMVICHSDVVEVLLALQRFFDELEDLA